AGPRPSPSRSGTGVTRDRPAGRRAADRASRRSGRHTGCTSSPPGLSRSRGWWSCRRLPEPECGLVGVAIDVRRPIWRAGRGDRPARTAILEERQRGVRVRRTGEQVALTELTAKGSQSLQLTGRLDAFGDDREIERPTERHDRGSERPVLRAIGRTHELARDLEDVDTEPPEIAQG